MKGITLCADCAYYSMKKHCCTRGATQDPDPSAPFYADCPLDEVVPVRTGRWVMTLYTTTSKRGRVISNKKYACSECGYSNGRKQSDYCPNFGAKMDKEADHE